MLKSDIYPANSRDLRERSKYDEFEKNLDSGGRHDASHV